MRLHHLTDKLSKRLDLVESRLMDVEKVTKSVVADQDTMKRSLAEHEEWMQSLDTKLESARTAVDVLRKEVQSTSTRRLGYVGLIMVCIFIFFGVFR